MILHAKHGRTPISEFCSICSGILRVIHYIIVKQRLNFHLTWRACECGFFSNRVRKRLAELF